MNADASIQGTRVGYWAVDEYENNAMTFTTFQPKLTPIEDLFI